MYYDFHEKVGHIVSHRILAINRAEKEKVISVDLVIDEEKLLARLKARVMRRRQTFLEDVITECVHDAYKRLIAPSIIREIRSELTEMAEDKALECIIHQSGKTAVTATDERSYGFRC